MGSRRPPSTCSTGRRPASTITVLFNPAEYTHRARQHLQVHVSSRPERAAAAVHQRRGRRAVDGAVPRRLHRPAAPGGKSVQERIDDIAHLLEIDDSCMRRRTCASSGAQLTLQGHHREAVAQDHAVPAGRHAGARDAQRLVQGIQDAARAGQRAAAAVGRQEQAARDRRRRLAVAAGRRANTAIRRSGAPSPSTTIWTTRATSRRATG